MKPATTIAVLAAVSAAVGCGPSPRRSDGTGTTDSVAAQSRVMTTASPPSTRAVGMVSGRLGALAATSSAPSSDLAEDGATAQTPTGIDPFQGIDASSSAPAMVIHTGQAFIEVEKIDPAIAKIRQLAAQVGGFIGNASISGGRDQVRQASIELKIPARNYEQAIGTLSSIGKVETVNSNAQDVGEEFVDVTARVTNSKRLEERLINLLATRTGKLDDVLRVERELARVREEIERYEGRLRYLSARAAMSTLSINVHEPTPILGNSPGESPIAAAFKQAWRNFIALVAGSISALGVLIPLALIVIAALAGYRRWRKRAAL